MSDRDTELLEKEEILEDGDHERYSHYVKKDKIVSSAVMGNAVIALCGKVWVPSRAPRSFLCAQPARRFTKSSSPN